MLGLVELLLLLLLLEKKLLLLLDAEPSLIRDRFLGLSDGMDHPLALSLGCLETVLRTLISSVLVRSAFSNLAKKLKILKKLKKT